MGTTLSTIPTSSVRPAFQLFSGEFLQFAILFLVLAVIAALFGARGVAGISMEIAQWFVLLFVVLTVLSLVL